MIANEREGTGEQLLNDRWNKGVGQSSSDYNQSTDTRVYKKKTCLTCNPNITCKQLWTRHEGKASNMASDNACKIEHEEAEKQDHNS